MNPHDVMPYENAEDDLWFDAIDLRAAFANQHYGQSTDMWANTVRQAVGRIADRKYVIDTGMPIVVTESTLKAKIVVGSYPDRDDSQPPPKIVIDPRCRGLLAEFDSVPNPFDRDQQAHMGVEFD